jgi:hypothetical protein
MMFINLRPLHDCGRWAAVPALLPCSPCSISAVASGTFNEVVPATDKLQIRTIEPLVILLSTVHFISRYARFVLTVLYQLPRFRDAESNETGNNKGLNGEVPSELGLNLL